MNKELSCITREIEGRDFKFVVNLAAGLRAWKRIVRDQEVYKSLQECLSQSEECSQDLVIHIFELARIAIDERYEHPYDAALATYLLALSATRPGKLNAVISALASVPQLWWAGNIARQISEPKKQEAFTVEFYVVSIGELSTYPVRFRRVDVKDSSLHLDIGATHGMLFSSTDTLSTVTHNASDEEPIHISFADRQREMWPTPPKWFLPQPTEGTVDHIEYVSLPSNE